jgi:hypothetical protein
MAQKQVAIMPANATSVKVSTNVIKQLAQRARSACKCLCLVIPGSRLRAPRNDEGDICTLAG